MNDKKKYNRFKVNVILTLALQLTRPPSSQAYGQSKLANVLFAQELAARVKSKNILVLVAMVERKFWS